MPHSSPALDSRSFVARDPRAFASAALALPDATHFAVSGYGRLRKWLSGVSRTREPLSPDIDLDSGTVVFQCGLDFVARDSVRRLLLRAQEDIDRRGIVTIHHWWLYSDKGPLLACWDWHHCAEPVQVHVSLQPWVSELVDSGVVAPLGAI